MAYGFEALSVLLIYCTHDSFLTFCLSHIYFDHLLSFQIYCTHLSVPHVSFARAYNRLDLSVYHNRRLLEQQRTDPVLSYFAAQCAAVTERVPLPQGRPGPVTRCAPNSQSCGSTVTY